MPATQITNSPDIVSLSLLGYANGCNGLFYLDISPSIYIGGNNTLVLGANFKITNPQGVIVKPFGSNYEIAPGLSGGMDAAVTFSIPTIAGGYQLGTYTLEVELFDRNGTRYTNSKTLKLCAPDSSKHSLKYGSLSAKLTGNCQDGKLSVIVDGVPNYQGVVVTSQTNAFTLLYPTVSGVAPLDSAYMNFTVALYEGVYSISGTICAVYNLGDSIFVSVLYKVKAEKNIRCLIDLCCINDAFNALRAQRNSDCSDAEKNKTASTIVDALFLLEDARLTANCGEDPSDIISELETLLGCKCTCNCNEGTPVINNTPVADSSIEGCGFTKQTVGLTTVYTLNNYSYEVSIEPNGGALTISDATLEGCTQTQVITFNIHTVYANIKSLATTDSCAWAAIVRRCLVGLDLTCLGYTAQQVAPMTLLQIFQALANAACDGGACVSKVNNVTVEQSGRFIIIKWNEDSAAASVDIYLNGNLIANILAGIEVYQYPYDIALSFQLTVIPRCANGAQGFGETITVDNVLRPPFIAPPQIYSPFLQNPCPYDITTNIQVLPLGITVEFHTANNTDASSLVADPTNALQGVYFVFGKDNNGFYSEGVQMQLVCDTAGSCSMPQNLQVVPQVGGNLVKFQSAAYPPPMNSYTVRRRLKADADILANYTTLGTPIWNASISRWVINDNTAVSNELYTYRAISNCGSTAPYIDFDFASINCPTLSLVAKVREVDYSFAPIGGSVDKVETTIYSDNGITVVHTDTHVPGFSNPVTGSFFYLDPLKDYWIGTKIYIGTYSRTCVTRMVTTLNDAAVLTIDYIAGSWTAQLNTPIPIAINILTGNQVLGSVASNCVGTLQTDTIPNMTIPIGSLSAVANTNGLNYLSVYYHIEDGVSINGFGNINDGETFITGDVTVTMKINHLVCSFYPA